MGRESNPGAAWSKSDALKEYKVKVRTGKAALNGFIKAEVQKERIKKIELSKDRTRDPRGVRPTR